MTDHTIPADELETRYHEALGKLLVVDGVMDRAMDHFEVEHGADHHYERLLGARAILDDVRVVMENLHDRIE